jgi:lipoprotein-anchoring transpeptidase ErfK/SrfK
MLRVAIGLPRALALGFLALSCPVATASAQVASAAGEAAAPTAAFDTLSPGQYRWHPEAAPAEGPVAIVVSIPLQRAYVFRAGILIGFSTVSTGQPGYDTPTGVFPILQKKVDHRSSLYDDAPMPYMQRLTWDGVALHAGHVAAVPASHGCIRLPHDFARRLYAVTALGASVVVTDQAPATPEEALALAS